MDTFLGLDAVMLARIQFAFTVAFHFLFPAFSIGLASYLAVLNGMFLWTREEAYLRLFRYWVKIFAITFAMGVVSGIVMSYQFGTNWSVFSDLAGPVIGPLMAYEVLTAFFLEAGFLGIMLFGREKVGPTLHMTACLMVAVGTAISATWILSVNSWMHTPQGFTIDAESGQFLPADWWQIVFTPSFPYRLAHTLTAAYLTTAFIVGGVGALHYLRGHGRNHGVRTMFSMAMWMAAIVAPLQIFLGDMHGLNTLEHQPAKVMAMEGHFESHPDGAPLILFGLPDQEAGEVRWSVEIPKLSSLILKHDLNAPLDGLDTVPLEDQPPVAVVFWSFRIMVGIGFLMATVGLWSLVSRFRGRLDDDVWLHRAALVMAPSGLVAVIAGWITTEVGRQPWVVYGQLRTADAASPIAASAVGWSLIAFILVYFAVFGVGILYLLRLMNRPPEAGERGARDEPGPIRTAGTTPGPQAAEASQGGVAPMFVSIDLTIAWALLLAFAVYVYVILDGFDLGIGILYPLFPGKRDRDLLMNSVAPVWDGNETWLVLGGGGLFAAFPLAYAVIMPAVYPPLIAMLLALVFRGVAFEFRWRTTRRFSSWFWDNAFFGASLVAAMAQGIILGALLQGIEVENRSYAGGWLDWLTPFSILCGIGVVCGYALLGCCWLILKTTGEVHDKARRLAYIVGPATVATIVAVSLATPFLEPTYFSRWFTWPTMLWLSPVPVAVALLTLALARTLVTEGRDWLPFVIALALFGLCFAGLGLSMWPYVIPTEVTIFDAAAPRSSQLFMFVGAIVLIPIILAYTAYAYWVFRGKLDPDEGYH